MIDTDWKSLLNSLSPNLSFSEAADRLKKPYQSVRSAMKKHGYASSDGRKSNINIGEINWKDSNVKISRQFNVSRERIRVLRKKLQMPFVEARGRKKTHHDNTPDVAHVCDSGKRPVCEDRCACMGETLRTVGEKSGDQKHGCSCA